MDNDPMASQVADATYFHEQSTTDISSGVTFTPYVHNGMVGYKCEAHDGSVEYLYLNPTDCSDDGQGNIFVYHGVEGEPWLDGSACYLNVFDTPKETT